MRTIGIAALTVALGIATGAAAEEPSRVEQILAGSASWMPADFNRGMEQLEALGDEAIPELVRLLGEERSSDRLFPICEAVGRIPDSRSLPALRPRLTHTDWLVRSSCGVAYAKILSAGKGIEGDLEPLIPVIQSDASCIVRRNVAGAVGGAASPELRTYFESRVFQSRQCDRLVAIRGLAGTPEPDDEVGEKLVAVFTDPAAPTEIREEAAWALTEFHYTPARKPLLAYLATGEPGGNTRAFAIQALGHVGTIEDFAVLEAVIANDPYGGESIWAVRAREAIAEIERRMELGL